MGPLSEENKGTFGQIFDKFNVDALSPPNIHRPGLVLIGPKVHDEFIKEIDNLKIEYKLHADDVKKYVNVHNLNSLNRVKLISTMTDFLKSSVK